MKPEQRKFKVAHLINMIAPYRLPIYKAIGSNFDFAIFYGGQEGNRNWQNLETKLSGISIKRSWGFTLCFNRTKNGSVYDRKFIHLTLGYFFDLLRYRPDAVITTEMGFRTLVALLYGTVFHKPVWIWWGGTLHSESSISQFKNSLRWFISRWAKRWISYGEGSTKYLLSLGVIRERILQIQNCVDEQLYLQPTESVVHFEVKPVFLYVGQFIQRKGIHRLLEAVARLQHEGYCFSLFLVGEGPEEIALEALIQELSLQNVYFYPNQPSEAMPAIYSSADYLVFPTLEDIWGLVVNEAIWSGLPVLASVYAGCAEELLPKENLFDPVNQDNFVAALKRALEGKVIPIERFKLKTCAEVADMIINDIKKTINS